MRAAILIIASNGIIARLIDNLSDQRIININLKWHQVDQGALSRVNKSYFARTHDPSILAYGICTQKTLIKPKTPNSESDVTLRIVLSDTKLVPDYFSLNDISNYDSDVKLPGFSEGMYLICDPEAQSNEPALVEGGIDQAIVSESAQQLYIKAFSLQKEKARDDSISYKQIVEAYKAAADAGSYKAGQWLQEQSLLPLEGSKAYSVMDKFGFQEVFGTGGKTIYIDSGGEHMSRSDNRW